jgi:hypothetical protein
MKNNISDDLYQFLLSQKDIDEKERKNLEDFIQNIINATSPVYDYIDSLKKDKEKIKDIISIIDLLKKES